MPSGDLIVSNVGAVGDVRDVNDYLLSPEVWNFTQNMRFRDGKASVAGAAKEYFTPPSGAPYFLMPIRDIATTWWLYLTLTKGYVFDGTTHTDITRTVGGDYNTQSARYTNGTILGGIPIINTGADDPQFWASYSAATKLADLTNWPANTTCRVLRSLGNFLVALGITESGTNYPHRVLWSHPAVPGSVPSSWDPSDTSKDTGEVDLSDSESGVILDARVLGSTLYIYKENAVWRMYHIGGQDIFSLKEFLTSVGVLTDRCVLTIGQGDHHLVLTKDDLILHNGQNVESILNATWRKELFNSLDPVNYVNSFVFSDPGQQEMGVCYPEQGNEFPNKQLVWNYRDRTLVSRDCDFQAAAVGPVDSSADEGTWDSDEDTWDSDEDVWSVTKTQQVITVNPVGSKTLKLDAGLDNDGAAVPRVLRRTGLAYVGQMHRNKPVADQKVVKTVTRMWLRASGDVFRVRMGGQTRIDGAVTWTSYINFDPEIDRWVDFTTGTGIPTGPFYAVEFSSMGSEVWTVEGYRLEIMADGMFV